MELKITNYETTVIKGVVTNVFIGTAEGIDFVADFSSSEYCGAEWSNGATKGNGFDTLYEKYGDDFTISIGQWWDIYSDVLEELCFGIEHKVNVCYEHALKKEVA
jgi:hypothetical protein